MATITEIWVPYEDSTPLQWTANTTSSEDGDHWQQIDDADRNPDTPSTNPPLTYIDPGANADDQEDTFKMIPESGASVLTEITNITVYAYGLDVDDSSILVQAHIDNSGGNLLTVGGSLNWGATAQWDSVTSAGTWTAEDFIGCEVRLDCGTMGAADQPRVYIMYLVLTGYSSGSHTHILRPIDNGTTTDWQTQTGTDHAAMVNEVVTQPTAADTGSYVLIDTGDDNDVEELIMDTNNFTIGFSGRIDLWIYRFESGNGGCPDMTVAIKTDGSWGSTQNVSWPQPAAWSQTTFRGVWKNTDFDDFQVRMTAPLVGGSNEGTVYALYCEVYHYPTQPS